MTPPTLNIMARVFQFRHPHRGRPTEADSLNSLSRISDRPNGAKQLSEGRQPWKQSIKTSSPARATEKPSFAPSGLLLSCPIPRGSAPGYPLAGLSGRFRLPLSEFRIGIFVHRHLHLQIHEQSYLSPAQPKLRISDLPRSHLVITLETSRRCLGVIS